MEHRSKSPSTFVASLVTTSLKGLNGKICSVTNITLTPSTFIVFSYSKNSSVFSIFKINVHECVMTIVNLSLL